MAGDLGVVCEYCVVADDTIVRDMRVRHQPVVVADARDARILHRASIDRAVLANRIAFADLERRSLASVFFVLRVIADRCKLKYMIVAADPP